uniref:Uncharacterized protein n=1 Tax=Anopheles atroparvus TaxID=41427 RepID=A0A182IX97_ANOAO
MSSFSCQCGLRDAEDTRCCADCACLEVPPQDASPEVPEEVVPAIAEDEAPEDEYWGPRRATEEDLRAVVGEMAWVCTALCSTPRPLPPDVVATIVSYQRGYLPLRTAHAILIDRMCDLIFAYEDQKL